MRHSLLPALLALPLLLVLATLPGHAVTFSFASDDNHDGPTFRGNSGGSQPNDLNDGAVLSLDGRVNVDLMVDKNGDGNGGVVILPSYFSFAGNISGFTLSARGAAWVIQWDVSGVFSFIDPATGGLLLSVSFEQALLTTYSPNVFTMGTTATLQSSVAVDPSLTFTTTALFRQKTGLLASSLASAEDFAFTMTHLRCIDWAGCIPQIDHGLFLRNWASEGSFSAHTAGLAAAEVAATKSLP